MVFVFLRQAWWIRKKGEIIYSSALIPNYTGTKIKEIIEKAFGIPCEVENDVNCAGLAEYISGAGKGMNPMLMLTIGTGIGGCLMLMAKYSMDLGIVQVSLAICI